MAGVTVDTSEMVEFVAGLEISMATRAEMEDVLAEERLALMDLFRGSGQQTLLTGRDGEVPRETGDLLNSLTPFHEGLALIISSRVEYAEFAHFSGESTGRTAEDVTAAFLAMTERVQARWSDLIVAGLTPGLV